MFLKWVEYSFGSFELGFTIISQRGFDISPSPLKNLK